MTDLVALLEEPGACAVKTDCGSGNAIFRYPARIPAKLEKRIGAAVGKAFGFEPLVLLLEVGELERIMAATPFVDDIRHPRELLVSFLGVMPENPVLSAIEAVKLKRSKVLEPALGVGNAGTGRTWSTLVRVPELAKSMV